MNTNLIPDLPFTFIIDNVNNTFTVTNTWFDPSGWVMYDVVRDYDGTYQTVSAVTLMTNLKYKDWKVVKEENEMKKIKATDLKGFVSYEHQPYTDYNKDIADWLTENAAQVDFKNHTDRSCYIFTYRNGEFYSHCPVMSFDVYYTNEEFKEWIGMTKKTVNKGFTKADLKDGMICTTREGYIYTVQGDRMTREGMYMMLEDINDDLTVTGLDFLDIIYVHQKVFERIDQKQLAIQKELEFAKAKAERLAAHISVLESKLK